MDSVVIGMDPHKRSVVMAADETILGVERHGGSMPCGRSSNVSYSAVPDDTVRGLRGKSTRSARACVRGPALRRVPTVGSLLGGDASPIGWSVQYLQAPRDVVLAEILKARAEWGDVIEVATARPFPGVLHDLLPFEAPWTRELVICCGRWTAYLNNGVNGGDATAIGGALMKRLGVRLVVADNSPKYGPGHQATQLWVLGPDGEPPLMYRRAIAAHATDGRWTWDEWGVPFDFEHTERYGARRIGERFDRGLLVEYLEQLGIDADDDSFYGDGILIQQRVPYPTRTESLEQAKAAIADAGR